MITLLTILHRASVATSWAFTALILLFIFDDFSMWHAVFWLCLWLVIDLAWGFVVCAPLKYGLLRAISKEDAQTKAI